MSTRLEELTKDVPGIGRCFSHRCRYADVGSPAICSTCAMSRLDRLAPVSARCPLCDHPRKADGTCGNPICGPYKTRYFTRNYSIAPKRGIMHRLVIDYKEGDRKWGPILARVLLGFLDASALIFRPFDLIVAMPDYLGSDGRPFDHVREMLRSADAQAPGDWPFDLGDPPAVVKSTRTDKMTSLSTYAERRDIGPTLQKAFTVPDRARTVGRRLIVVDDVFTTGTTLNSVSEVLRRQGGAREIVSITLARQIKAQPVEPPSEGPVDLQF